MGLFTLLAAETATQQGWVVFPSIGLAILGIAIGAGIIVLGAAKGIGHLAGSAMEGIARQPEAGGRIGTNMIIAAALIEGFTFFALAICYLMIAQIK